MTGVVGCMPVLLGKDKMGQTQRIWDWRGEGMAARRANSTSGLLSTRQLSQLPAVMPADSWHGREPKITQTAGARGCHGHSCWAGSQDTWNPLLAAGGDLVTLGESLILSEGG